GPEFYLAKILSVSNLVNGGPVQSGVSDLRTANIRYGKGGTTTAKSIGIIVNIDILHVPTIVIVCAIIGIVSIHKYGNPLSIPPGTSVISFISLPIDNIVCDKSDFPSDIVFIT